MRAAKKKRLAGVTFGVLASFTLTAIGWLTPGCSQFKKARPGSIARWEHALNMRNPWAPEPPGPVPPTLGYRAIADMPEAESSSGGPGPAPSPEPICLKDRIKSDWLRTDVSRIEAMRPGGPVRATWQGKDVSSLPPAQGEFLSHSARWLYTKNIDFSECNDLPCMLNRIYGTPDSDNGWAIYGWYLKTGYVLAAQDFLPADGPTDEQNNPAEMRGEGLAAHSYFFKPAELLGFWLESFMLPDSLKMLKSVDTLHRVPSGVRPQGWGDSTCGMWWGTRYQGNIRFSDACLTVSDDPHNLDAGDFYVKVAHELAHGLDMELGPSTNGFGDQRLSEQDAWLALSGWRREFVAGDGAPGVTYFRWVRDGKKDNFITDYAGTSPAEDWAESVAYYRFDPDKMTRVAPDKAAFVQKAVYGGRSFVPDGLGKYYEEQAASTLVSGLPDLMESCLAVTQTAPGSQASAPPAPPSAAAPENVVHLALSVALAPPVVACLQQGLGSRITDALNELRAVEYEACDYFADNEAALRDRLAQRLTPEINRLLEHQSSLGAVFAATRKLREALVEAVDPREAYLHCFRQSSPQACFADTLSQAFDNAGKPFASSLGDGYATVRTDYLSDNGYAKAAARVSEFYREVFAGIEPVLAQSAASRWEACMGATGTPSADAVATTPFSGGAQYVDGAILNCINGSALNDINAVRDRFIHRLGLGVDDPDAKAYVESFLLPPYLSTLSARLTEAAADEEKSRSRLKSKTLQAVDAGLASNSRWGEGQDLEASCEGVAQRAFDQYFEEGAQGAEQGGLPSRFGAYEDTRARWSREACEKSVAQRAQRARRGARRGAGKNEE